MTDHTASRTLVKSAPELWAECSDAASLTRHLGAFGEIRITRLEPETAVAWEGDAISGTVRLEPSGWGTRVILSATAAAREAVDAQPFDPVETAAVEVIEPVNAAPNAQLEGETEPEAGAGSPEPDADGPEADADEPAPETEEYDARESPATAKLGALGRLLMRLGLRRRPEPETADESDETELLLEPPATPDPDVTPNPAVIPEPPAAPQGGAMPEPADALESLYRRARPAPPPARSEAGAVLDAALDSLGRAHHRPYSRS